MSGIASDQTVFICGRYSSHNVRLSVIQHSSMCSSEALDISLDVEKAGFGRNGPIYFPHFKDYHSRGSVF